MLRAARSSLLLQHTARICIFILFCMWPYNRICCPWLLFSYSAVFTMPKLVMDLVPPQFEHRWVLQATSAVAQLPPGIFCYFATAEAVGEETLLKIPVPKPTPVQLLISPPAAGGEMRVLVDAALVLPSLHLQPLDCSVKWAMGASVTPVQLGVTAACTGY